MRAMHSPFTLSGSVIEARGTIVQAVIPEPIIGSRVRIETKSGTKTAVVSAFKKPYVSLSVLGSLQGISPMDRVYQLQDTQCQKEHYLQCGAAHDYKGDIIIEGSSNNFLNTQKYPFAPQETQTQVKESLREPLHTGMKVIDTCTPFAKGQRMLVIAQAGTGKSTFLSSCLKSIDVDLSIIALVGERGREISDYHNRLSKYPKDSRSFIVSSSSDNSPTQQIQAVETSLQIAEEQCARGKHVAIAIDSLTRYIRALRNISVANGETTSRSGYPISVFSELAKLLERFGTYNSGSITGIFTMLQQDEDLADEAIEEAVSLCDGHIHLSKSLAERGIFPAIDLSKSISRIQRDISSENQLEESQSIRKLSTKLLEEEDMIMLSGNKEAQDTFANKRQQLENFISRGETQGLFE